METRDGMWWRALVGAVALTASLTPDVMARGNRSSGGRQVVSRSQNNNGQSGDSRNANNRGLQFNPQGPGNPNWQQPANNYARGYAPPNNFATPYGNYPARSPYYGPQPGYYPSGVNQANYNYSNGSSRTSSGVVPSNYVAPTPVAKAVPPAPVKTPTVARPLTVRESAAALLVAQTRDAAWDAYENYSASPGYADAYRELHKLLQSVKSLSQEATRQATSDKVTETFAAALQEAEINLQVLQVQTESWQRAAAADRPDLQVQLQKMAASLAELMAASKVESQLYAAVDEEPATIIRAKE